MSGRPWRLAGRVGVVAGVDSATGRAVAEALAAEGMSLALTGRAAATQYVAALLEPLGVAVFPAATDVTDPAAVRRLVAQVEQRLGPVDVLVLARPAEALLEDVLPSLIAARRGRIILLEGGGLRPLAERLAGTGVTVFAVEADGPAALVARFVVEVATGVHDDDAEKGVTPRFA